MRKIKRLFKSSRRQSFLKKDYFFKISFKNFIPQPVLVFLRKKIAFSLFLIKKNGPFLFCLFMALLFSDLLLIKSHSLLLPSPELPPLRAVRPVPYAGLSLESYKNIWESNIFHTGPIPLRLEETTKISTEPVLSSLPFKLRGTIIHANPHRSVASITAGSNPSALSYQTGDIIEKQAQVREIQRAKVFFLNQNNNQIEYIEIPKDQKALNIFWPEDKLPKKQESRLIEREGNHFRVKRSDINEYLQKLPEILKQARVVPHHSPEGQIKGFRFASIKKGSVFETELGFKKGDIIKEVDGEAVTTPEKALELFDRLKGSGGFKILVEKDGKDMYYEYNVNEDSSIL